MSRLIYSRWWWLVARLLVVAGIGVYVIAVLAFVRLFEAIGDPVIRYAVAFVAAQTYILATLLAGLLVSKHIRVRRAAIRSARKRRLEDLLTQLVSFGEQFAAAPGAPDEFLNAVEDALRKWPDDLLDVVGEALRILKGSTQRRIVAALEASSVVAHLLPQVMDPDPNCALRAISLLQRLDTPDCWPAMERALEHPAEAVRMAARKAVLLGADEAAQHRVLHALPEMPLLQRIVMFHLIPVSSRLLREFLSGALVSGQEDLTLVAFELVLTRQRLMPIAVPARLAASPNPEIRIRFFKALPLLCFEGDLVALLKQGLADSDWRVRAMAARACGCFRTAAVIPELLAMCGSFANPAEAGHAARSLAAMGGEAWMGLQQVAATGTHWARRVTTEVVERRMVSQSEVRA